MMPVPPPTADKNFLLNVFYSVDTDRSGHISADELQKALSNGTWKPFNKETVKLMIGMFDRDKTGSIDFNEFAALWRYITDWSNVFRSYDRDGSGDIDANELRTALSSFEFAGYRLTEKVYALVTKKFCKGGSGRILFDDFIRVCVKIHNMTEIFRKKDTDHDGMITLQFDEYLVMAFSLSK